jgi:hypothetical protein
MERIRVLEDVDGEYAGKQISLRKGDYLANAVRVGYAVPGQDITQHPAASYVLENESDQRRNQSLTAQAFEELKRLGLIAVKK